MHLIVFYIPGFIVIGILAAFGVEAMTYNTMLAPVLLVVCFGPVLIAQVPLRSCWGRLERGWGWECQCRALERQCHGLKWHTLTSQPGNAGNADESPPHTPFF